jgi:hypothetical protein
MSQTEQWSDNRKELTRKMREFRTEMSEMSRLFQRAVMIGDEVELAKLKVLLKETNAKLIQLLDEIEK